jgi:hypothetical protein
MVLIYPGMGRVLFQVVLTGKKDIVSTGYYAIVRTVLVELHYLSETRLPDEERNHVSYSQIQSYKKTRNFLPNLPKVAIYSRGQELKSRLPAMMMMIPIQHVVHDRTSDRTKTTRKSVSFSPEVNNVPKHTLHIDDYTNSELVACWYSSNEYKKWTKEIKYIVGLIETKEYIDEEHYSQRGLEHLTQEGKLARSTRLTDTVDAVLKQQCHQRREGVS